MLKTQSLPPHVLKILLEKATEIPFSGLYTDYQQAGTYLCRQCGLALFRAKNQFHSGCGWPSFDEQILQTVKQQLDVDGQRIEIICQRCLAHLGHVFTGEHFTAKNIRYCVNSLSLDFVADTELTDSEEAIVAAGCFWGVEYLFKQLQGVVKTEVGYTGGLSPIPPTYEQVCQGNTGHFEALRIIYNPKQIHYQQIIKYFFEIHDFTQTNGQGPDLGTQYQSAIFYYNEEQYAIAQNLIQLLGHMKYEVATRLFPVQIFWPAEAKHQNYYNKMHKQPYCHRYMKRFSD